MKTLKLFSSFLFFSCLAYGQVSKMCLEAGPTLMTLHIPRGNTFSGQDRPTTEYLNGLFLRYSNSKFGIRTFASYLRFQTVPSGSSTFASFTGGSDGSSGNKTGGEWSGQFDYTDYKFGLGAQVPLLKKSDWLYTFLDLAYNKIQCAGYSYGDAPDYHNSFITTTNGLTTYMGLGFKLKVLNHLIASPEISYNFLYGQANGQRTSLVTGQTSNFNGKFKSGHPIIKLQLTYQIGRN